MKRYLSLFILIGLVGCSSELDRCIETNRALLTEDDLNLDKSLVDWGEIDFNKTSPKEIYTRINPEIAKDCPLDLFENINDYLDCLDSRIKHDLKNIKDENLSNNRKLEGQVSLYYYFSTTKDWGLKNDYPLVNKHPKNWTISDLNLLKENHLNTIKFLERRIKESKAFGGAEKEQQFNERTISETKKILAFIETWTEISIQTRLNEMPKQVCNEQGIY